MSGDLRVSMLFQANAAQAKAEVAGMRTEVDALARGAINAAKATSTAAPEIGAVGDAASMVATDLIIAAQAQAEWEAQVQMVRTSIQPLVGEMFGLQNALQQVAAYEEMGALTANEAALAHDVLSRKVIDLVGRMEAAGVSIDGTTSAMARQETSAQDLINRLTGVSNATTSTISDTLRHGMALDDLRARYNPLFAASRQYELELREIAEAERLGAITAREGAAARERVSQALAPVPNQLNRVGASSQQAAAYLGNLGFQLNDIVMMMSLGQSPFMLMMQQGPQVTQVFGQMRAAGMAIGPAISSAFFGMLNPVSLATMAVIGFGAAAVQWFSAAEEEVVSVEDALAELGAIQSRIEKANDILAMSLSELTEEYGTYAFAARDAARAVREHSIEQGKARLKEGIAEAADEWQRYAATMDAATAANPKTGMYGARGQFAVNLGETRQALKALQDDLNVSAEDAIKLAEAFGRVQSAASFGDRISALAGLEATLRAAGVAVGDLPPAISDAIIKAGELNLEMIDLAAAVDNGVDGLVAMVASAPGSGWLAGAIGDAGTLAGTLWNAATAAAAARQGAILNGEDPTGNKYGGRGGDPRNFGANAGTSNTFDTENFKVVPVKSGSGSTGSAGGGSTQDETSALKKLVDEQNRQIEALRIIDPLQAEIAKNHEALKDATEGETKAVTDLIAERMHLEEVRDRLDEIEQAGKSAFTGLLTGAHSFSEALDILLGNLAEMAASSAWDLIWGGGSGGGGGLGGIVSDALGLGPKAATSTGLGERSARSVSNMAGSAAPGSWIDASGGRNGAGGRADRGAGDVSRVPPVFNVHLHSATGNREISDMVSTGIKRGLSEYDTKVLPSRVAQISGKPRERG